MNFRFWRNAVKNDAAPGRVEPVAQDSKPGAMKISDMALLTTKGASIPPQVAYQLPSAAPGVVSQDAKMACDSAMDGNYTYAAQGVFAEGLGFLGYPYLSELTQRAEFRRPSEILAKHMTRKWIRLQCTGDEDKTDKLREIEAEMKRLRVQDMFQKATEQDGYFGRSQIYIDTGDSDDPDELRMPLAESAAKIQRTGIKALKVIEPIWTYPNAYNSNQPLKQDFFKPASWFVMGEQIHDSRLLTFVSRPVPDLLKPAYAFGGLSLSQIAKPYVDNWLRTRQSVSDLLHSFSTQGVKTNLTGILDGGGGEDMIRRAELFNQARDNRGLMLLDRDTEEFFNVAVPLGGLDHLQAQAQEHMAAVTGIPLIVLLGITPTGLNASSEGELQTFYSWIEAQQEALYTPLLSRLLNIIQLALYGEIDREIGFKYEPLWSLSEVELANARKVEADTDVELIGAGVINAQESRVRLASQEDGPYSGLDLSEELPEPPDPEDGSDDPSDDPDGQPPTRAEDADFNESKIKRAPDGKFGSGSGSTGSVVIVKGNELGDFGSMKELRQKALAYASEHIVGKQFTNEATGHDIQVARSGVKHTISNAGDELVRTIPAIPDLIRKGKLTASDAEKGGDPNIKAVETYEAPLEVDSKQHTAIMTVKVYQDGRRYYDHGLVK
jgi:phage-related protein (TIGR01555 family)